MTALCLRSLYYFYQDITRFYVLVDDLAPSWPNYLDQCAWLYHDYVPQCEIIPYSNLSGLDQCPVGWWRAQLVKLHADHLLPGDRWFVVDGDVIFDEHIDIEERTPYSVKINPDSQIMDSMVDRYIDTMLNRSDSRIVVDPWPKVVTSAIPFRWLERDQLQSLRQYVQKVNQQSSFLHWHIEMFRQQEIVGFVPEGDRMVMHEWELIEAWNHLYQPGRYQMHLASGGYHTSTHTAALEPPRFRHSSLRDRDLGQQWFSRQGIDVPSPLWERIQNV